jgi:hypothetical protein
MLDNTNSLITKANSNLLTQLFSNNGGSQNIPKTAPEKIIEKTSPFPKECTDRPFPHPNLDKEQIGVLSIGQ